MLFYFTGTGNSKWVANQLAQQLKDDVISINQLLKSEATPYQFNVPANDRVILVFPIYSWGIPTPIRLFLDRVQWQWEGERRLFAVATCGDNAGLANKMLAEKLAEQSIKLVSFHTVSMPNCYILMPGFDVDKEEVAKAKVTAAPERIKLIAKAIQEERQVKDLYAKGSLAWVKSRLIYPGFMKSAHHTQYYTTASCTHCGLCEKLCPMNNITLTNGTPQWKDQCVQCMACIQRCPSRAIEYGKVTQGKGRYSFEQLFASHAH